MYRMVLGAILFLGPLSAGAPAQQRTKPAVTPTVANLAYGKHERQVLDFWRAKSDKPTPLVLYIHGGGWRAGDKNTLGTAAIKRYLDAGISIAAINYRYIQQAVDQKVEPPVKAPKWTKESSPIEHVSKDDPPIALFYTKQDTPPVVGTSQKDPTHSAVMGIKLEERLKVAGVECVLVHQDHPHKEYKSAADFL